MSTRASLAGLFVVLVTAFPFWVQASSWLSCEFQAEVQAIRPNDIGRDASTHVIKIRLEHNSYHCEGSGGGEYPVPESAFWVTATTESNSLSISQGEMIEIKYARYSGMGPNGLVESEHWVILSD